MPTSEARAVDVLEARDVEEPLPLLLVNGGHGGDNRRRDLARRPFECELPGTEAEFAAMVQQGKEQGWPEVVLAGLYGLLRHAAEPPGGDPRVAVRSLLEQARSDGDLDMTALALAWRAWTAVATGGATDGLADEDLARALVILEQPGGDPVKRATAHFRVAFCLWHRQLWELADEQLASAEAMVDAVDPAGADPLLHRAALALDRALIQLDWACALREVGAEGAERCRDEQARVVKASARIVMPEDWRLHIELAALLLDVVAGSDRSEEVRAWLAKPIEGPLAEWEGHLHLAASLAASLAGRTAAGDAAVREAELAVASMEAGGATDSPAYSLALHHAAVLEAAALGRKTAGLRHAEALAAQRASDRRASLAATRAVIASQRLRSERDTLALQAHADPLTGLGNRRGVERHVASLRAQRVEEVALVLLDVDHFKPVNDCFGHLAGDSVLKRLSDVMTGNVRSGDFAARLGGDEFLLLLAGSSMAAATRRAEAISREIAEQRWPDIDPGLRVTASFGVAVGRPSDVDALNRQADLALYRAKASRPAMAKPA